MTDRAFLEWIHQRLAEVYLENPHVDHMIRLRQIIHTTTGTSPRPYVGESIHDMYKPHRYRPYPDQVWGVAIDDSVKNSETGVPCGGCHQRGYDPVISDGRCEVCSRTPAEIAQAHGKCMLTDEEIVKYRGAPAGVTVHFVGKTDPEGPAS